jgi:glycosyltransferase involved in cell wall biosynthesis
MKRQWIPRLAEEAKTVVRRASSNIPRDGRPSWFPLDSDVDSRIVARWHGAAPDADIVIATAWETAAPVAALTAAKGRKLHLIQHYETWAGPKALVDASWRLPVEKIVISKWLAGVARELGVAEPVTYIPNGIDLDRFRVKIPIGTRVDYQVGLLAHSWTWKGFADGVRALELVRESIPELRVVAFGTGTRPRAPEWLEFRHNVTGEALVDLYNSLAVFVHPSWMEGWPLPPAEAMASGCALAASANCGVSDYATHGETALMAPVHDTEGLAEAICQLILDRDLRLRIATTGHDAIGMYTWATAADRLERLLENWP